MKRVMYITRTSLQLGSSPMNVRTFRGIVGNDEDVPDDIAALLVAQGIAVLAVEEKPPAAPKPAAAPEKEPARTPASRRKRQK